MQRVFDIVLRRVRPQPEIPLCPDHQTEMRLRGKLGRPTRFTDQTEEQYTLVYFCPVPNCNHTAERTRAATEIPAPGQSPERPSFARRGD